MMEFPEGWSLDYIASGAFSKSKHLKSLTFIDNLTGIYPNIFEGVESDEITLRFWTSAVPELIVDKEGVPFTFGVDNAKIKLEINSGMGEEFINGWSYPLTGYSNRTAMEEAVKAEIVAANGSEPTKDELKTEVDKRILPYMNTVRRWLGLAAVESVDEIKAGTAAITDDVENANAEKHLEDDKNLLESTVQGNDAKKEYDSISQDKETKEETEE